MRKNLPIGIQSFERIIRDNYLYVDKTKDIYNLVTTGKIYFLSRPRRFGKSLLISTLEAYFLGKRDLFKELAIETLEKDWEEYPVLHLDLNAENYEDESVLESRLNRFLSIQEDIYGRKQEDVTLSQRFQTIIQNIVKITGRRVVVLVDEYDKPLLNTIDDCQLHTKMKNILKGFYGVFKSEDANLRFVFLTGVTKFGQVSVFSDLNQLDDISNTNMYSTICGLTSEELRTTLLPYVGAFAKENNLTLEEAFLVLKQMYDGYHFSRNLSDIYNPFSLLNVLKYRELGRFWFQTGTPTFLVEVMKRTKMDITGLEEGKYRPSEFLDYKADIENPIPLLYQSGYLTIKGYDKQYDLYLLGYPNDEVRYGFLEFLMPYYITASSGFSVIADFTNAIEKGDVEGFMNLLQGFLSGIPYDMIVEKENYFHTVFYLVFRLMGQFVDCEVKSSHGRSDAVVKTRKWIYLFEFKLDKPAGQALEQIESKEYGLPYVMDERPCIKIGVSFSSEKRNISEYLIKK